eukprot:3503418-Prymnesium_polylepis.1
MAMVRATQRTLPFTLAITFVMAPPISIRIFRTFLCESFRYDDDLVVTKTYLRGDLSLSCQSDEYSKLEFQTTFLVLMWPIGVPFLFSDL